jgi:hypothetical protein
MKKKLLVMGVVVIALLGFSGIASSSVYMQYWETKNSRGWIYYGEFVPGYTFYGKYNYVDHMVWKEFDGVIYEPTHENWHISWDSKSLYRGKLCLILHYNFMYHVEFTPKKDTLKYQGYLHLTDPAAADPATQLYLVHFKIPAITKFKWGKGHPTIEDTTTLFDFIFENFDYTLMPLIDRIEFSGVSISVSLL